MAGAMSCIIVLGIFGAAAMTMIVTIYCTLSIVILVPAFILMVTPYIPYGLIKMVTNVKTIRTWGGWLALPLIMFVKPY